MGQVFNEGYDLIGSIDDDGYIYNASGNRLGKINNSGYAHRENGSLWFKIDEDGTIRDKSYHVIGNLQANGYVYIHSERVCKVSSNFLEKITPKASNYGEPSTYSGRASSTSNSSSDYSGSGSFFTSSFFIKIVIGEILGIIMMINGAGGPGMLLAGPIFVFLMSFFAKIFG